jgi:dipeptidyl aminopeptidase/acylaminoacyl peptidase
MLPSKSMLVISPSSERVAFRDTFDGEDTVKIMELNTGNLISAVNVSAVKPSNIYFIDDNTLIFIASENKRIAGFKGRHNISVAYSYDLDKNKIRQLLIQGNGIYKGQSELGVILGVSPDKRYAYMPAYGNETDYHLYRILLKKRGKPRVHQKGSSDTIDFFLNKEGKVIARERFNNIKNRHWVESNVSGKWQTIFNHDTAYRNHSFVGVTPDRQSLVMLATQKETGRWSYYTVSLQDGEIAGPIFSKSDKDVESVITDINRVVYGVRYSGFSPSYEFFDKKLNARMSGIKNALPNNYFTIQDYTPDWNNIIFYMDGAKSSGDYLMYNRGKIEFVTSTRPQIEGNQVNEVIEYNFTARDGLNIPTLLTVPNNIAPTNLPAIIMPHGGPESYDTAGFDYLSQYFASQGFLVIQPQFRGSSGFGQAHLLAGRGQWGRKMQNDLTDAIVALANEGKINKDKLCIVGASYGGYAALAGATFTPDLYKCVVSINGVSDVEAMLKEEEDTYGGDHWVVAYWQDVISQGDLEKDHLEQISPINHVNKIKVPVLLIHGFYDKVVPRKQSEKMYDKMKNANKDVTYVSLKRGDHYLSSANNRMKAMKAISQFIEQHISK